MQASISLVFQKFREFGSVRQVLIWLRQEGIELPCIAHEGEDRRLHWRLPVYQTILGILTNPVYAGAYAYGQTTSRVKLENGRKRVTQGVRVAREDWPVLIVDHHEGYIGWGEYEANQRAIAENAAMKGALVRGPVRKGSALLAGLLRCGHCGRKLHVSYSGRQSAARYHCRGAMGNHGVEDCGVSFGSLRVELAVADEVLRVLQPLGVSAALDAIGRCEEAASQKRRQCELALEQARYEAKLARRQYDAVDPDNRLVASELEHRWNEALKTVARREEELASTGAEVAELSVDEDRDRLLALGHDVPAAWHHPAAPSEIKKRLLRTVLKEIVVTIADGKVRLVAHWQGGDHTFFEVNKQRAGEHRWQTDIETKRIVAELARLLPDSTIAAFLNRAGRQSAKGHAWTVARVCAFRSLHEIPRYRDGERRERGEVILNEAAQALGVSTMTVLRLIREKALPARQACPGAPWVIVRADLDVPTVRAAIGRGRGPLTADPRQQPLPFQ